MACRRYPAHAVIFLLFLSVVVLAQDYIPFESENWLQADAQVVDYLGRRALMGAAFLKEVDFADGIIKVDMAVTGARSYPGIIFRSTAEGQWERVYIRLHRSGCISPSLYSDVVQYVPACNRVDSWQLYNGEGYTAGAVIPLNRWFTVRIEVSGTQARVFIDGAEEPALKIHHLKHGVSRGGLGLMGPQDGSAYFSNFHFHKEQHKMLCHKIL